MDPRRRDATRPEQRLACGAHVAAGIVGRHAALVPPVPFDAVPRHVGASRECDHHPMPAAAAGERHGGAAAARRRAQRFRDELGRGSERRGVGLIDVDVHLAVLADRRRGGDRVDGRRGRV